MFNNIIGNSVQGGFMGNAGALAGNPFGPDFKIPGGQPWNKAPLLPGKDTKEFEERPLTRPFRQGLDRDRFGLPMAMGSSNLPNALPGAPGNAAGMMMSLLPGGEQGPAQGPNTPVKFYPGLGYAPYVQRG